MTDLQHGQRRLYEKLIKILLVIHVSWTLLLVVGAIAMFFDTAYAATEIYLMSFTLLITLPFNRRCPLTLLEEWLQEKLDPNYKKMNLFIGRYFNRVFKTHLSTLKIRRTTAALYVLAFAFAIAIIILRGYGFFGGQPMPFI
jgi:hypothetical protein